MKRLVPFAIVLGLVSASVRGDVYVCDDLGPLPLMRVSTGTNEVVQGHFTDWGSRDGLVSEDGSFLIGANSAAIEALDAPFDGFAYPVGRPPDGSTLHMNWAADGGLIALAAHRSHSLLYRYSLDGVVTSIDSPDADTGFSLEAMEVPTSGPFEGGVIALAYRRSDERWTLFRYELQPDGSFMRTQRGPLTDLEPKSCFSRDLGGWASQPVMRPSGESFLVTEPCTRSVKEFDLEGNYLGVFVTPPRLTGLGHYRDVNSPTDLAVTGEGDVWVLTYSKLYRHAPDGTLKAEVAHTWNLAQGVFNADYVPFASAPVTCEPAGLGYWKRQCRSLEPLPRRGPARTDRFGDPVMRHLAPLHPTFASLVDLRTVITRADSALARHGVTTCAALWPDDPSDRRSKALMHLAAGQCNVAAKRLSRSCELTAAGEVLEVSQILAQVNSLIEAGDDDSLQRAAHLATSLHTGGE